MLVLLSWVGRIFGTVWGRRLIYGLGSIGMLALGVAVGRYLTPAKVVTVTKTQTVTEVKTQIVTVHDRDVVRTVHRETRPSPAGPITTVDSTTRAVERTDTHAAETSVAATASVATRVVESHKPDWRVNAMGGVLILPGTQPSWLVGGQVERRILGPISVGVWGMGGPKAGAAGLLLGMEF